MRRHLQRSIERTPRIRIETFGLFLVMAGLLTSLEFAVFHVQTQWAHAGMTFWRPETAFDAQIPLLPAWIWPYWLYFAFLGTPIWLVKDRIELGAVAGGLTLVHFAGYACFLTWPSEMPREALTCNPFELACGLVGAMYLLDPGYGVFPSLHVAASVFLAIFAFDVRSPLRWPIALFTLAVIFSTVFVRQHYVIDLPAGILLGVLVGRIGMRVGREVVERAGIAEAVSLDKQGSLG